MYDECATDVAGPAMAQRASARRLDPSADLPDLVNITQRLHQLSEAIGPIYGNLNEFLMRCGRGGPPPAVVGSPATKPQEVGHFGEIFSVIDVIAEKLVAVNELANRTNRIG